MAQTDYLGWAFCRRSPVPRSDFGKPVRQGLWHFMVLICVHRVASCYRVHNVSQHSRALRANVRMLGKPVINRGMDESVKKVADQSLKTRTTQAGFRFGNQLQNCVELRVSNNLVVPDYLSQLDFHVIQQSPARSALQ